MKAMVCEAPNKYCVREAPLPELEAGWALIRVRAAAFCATDLEALRGGIPAAYPVILGHEWCGEVVRVNSDDESLQGKRVTGSNDVCCLTCKACRSGRWRDCASFGEIGFKYNGAYAEYMAVPTYALREIPENVNDIQACMLEPLGVGLGVMDKVRARLGETLLIFGSGSIGLNILAVAKASGLRRITVVERSGGRLPIAAKMGADHVIATSRQNLEEAIAQIYGSDGPDIIIDATGSEACFRQALALAPKSGRVALAGYGGGREMTIRTDDIHIKNLVVAGAGNNWNVLDRCIELVADGLINTELLCTRVRPLEEFEAAARDADQRAPGFVKTVFLMGDRHG